jgi:hypothetical protein
MIGPNPALFSPAVVSWYEAKIGEARMKGEARTGEAQYYKLVTICKAGREPAAG